MRYKIKNILTSLASAKNLYIKPLPWSLEQLTLKILCKFNLNGEKVEMTQPKL